MEGCTTCNEHYLFVKYDGKGTITMKLSDFNVDAAATALDKARKLSPGEVCVYDFIKKILKKYLTDLTRSDTIRGHPIDEYVEDKKGYVLLKVGHEAALNAPPMKGPDGVRLCPLLPGTIKDKLSQVPLTLRMSDGQMYGRDFLGSAGMIEWPPGSDGPIAIFRLDEPERRQAEEYQVAKGQGDVAKEAWLVQWRSSEGSMQTGQGYKRVRHKRKHKRRKKTKKKPKPQVN